MNENERGRMVDGGAAAEADMTTEKFAAATPDIPADRIRCTECSEMYVGDERKGTICPDCRIEMGLEYPPTLPEGADA
jgi:hypothetical protein